MNKRLLQLMLAQITLTTCTITAVPTLVDRKAEPVIFAIAITVAIVIAYFVVPRLVFSTGKSSIIVLCLLALVFWRHREFPYQGYVYTMFTSSLMINAGQAFCLLMTLELYRLRIMQTNTPFITYTFLAMLTAAHSQVTNIFLTGIVLYALILLLYSRMSPMLALDDQQNVLVHQRLTSILSILILLSGCCGIALVLDYYREDLNTWHFLRLLRNRRQHIGFSPITRLGTKKISGSREPVLRYFTDKDCYYLRGKVFDRYQRCEWKLSRVGSRRIHKINGTYSLDRSLPSYCKPSTLLFLQRQPGPIFAPLDCRAIELSQKQVVVNSEGIFYCRLPLTEVKLLSLERVKTDGTLNRRQHKRYMHLPINKNYFTRLAQIITPQDKTQQQKIDAIVAYLRDNYPYSKHTLIDSGQEPIENFLRRKRGGHCEMFASALVMLARTCGIPARYVAGYYAHEWNYWGDFLTIRACDAHAWAEVYVEGRWHTVDACPPAALRKVLQQYRGFAETHRELIAEWWRRFLEKMQNASVAILVPTALGIAAFFLLLAAILKWRHNSQKQKISIAKARFRSDENTRRVRNLFMDFSGVSERFCPRYARQTAKEYFSSVQTMLPPSLQKFVTQLLPILERTVYGETPPDTTQVDQLEKEWQTLRKQLTAYNARSRN